MQQCPLLLATSYRLNKRHLTGMPAALRGRLPAFAKACWNCRRLLLPIFFTWCIQFSFASSLPDEFARQMWRVQDGLSEDIA